MASQSDEASGRLTCAIDVSPGTVEAGTDMTLRASVSCSPACDLRGHVLRIEDEAGQAVGSVEITTFDGAATATGELVVKAPVEARGHTWLAVCPALVKAGIAYPQESTPFSFTVAPHITHVVAWDLPSAIVAGEPFRIKVGIKCPRECDLAGRTIAVCDHEGKQVAAAALPGGHWPGTNGLYAAEIEAQAPADDGLYTWSVRFPESTAGMPHAESSTTVGVRVVRPPEYLVTVETVDRADQTPLGGAQVVMHPYRTVSDERGIAEVRVAKGTYKLFVSQTSYLTSGLPVEVTADMTARVELDLEPVLERN